MFKSIARTFRVPQACLILLLAGGAAARGQADPVVVNKPYTVGNYTTWESYSGPNTSGSGRTFDNFTLGGNTAITGVRWHGEYIDTVEPRNNPAAPNTDAFEVSFWSDSNGQPGVALATRSIPAASVTTTSLGTIGFSFNTGAGQIPFFSYRAALPTPFVAAAGQRYWVSIYSRSTSAQPTWSWYSGTGGDGQSVQDFQNARGLRELDRSLVLEGVPSTAPALPTVSVAATVNKARVGGGVPGVFTITLASPATAKLKVKYTLSGNAVNGQDYALLNGKAKFKAGQSSVDVLVQGQGDLGGAAKKKVKLSVQPGSAYTPGSAAGATVKIVP